MSNYFEIINDDNKVLINDETQGLYLLDIDIWRTVNIGGSTIFHDIKTHNDFDLPMVCGYKINKKTKKGSFANYGNYYTGAVSLNEIITGGCSSYKENLVVFGYPYKSESGVGIEVYNKETRIVYSSNYIGKRLKILKAFNNDSLGGSYKVPDDGSDIIVIPTGWIVDGNGTHHPKISFDGNQINISTIKTVEYFGGQMSNSASVIVGKLF
ncbi:hypothetical protein [Veillonella criceti]|uniref:Uncharacterized protein n=1 Tax=Veillonella criceti TaxID=103891 RepID=A0A380NJ41_9FIRM|nr:hypothetical protein [Veillonella criceti]SUP42226.1 Uncharacterised protein [Veillonella criceti]